MSESHRLMKEWRLTGKIRGFSIKTEPEAKRTIERIMEKETQMTFDREEEEVSDG